MIYRNEYSRIDRFCAKHPRFGIPNLIKVLIIGQIAVFIIDLLTNVMFDGAVATYYLCFSTPMILQGQVWRLISWVFVTYDSNPFYLLLGCYVLYWTGSMLEREWGSAKFNLFYLVGMALSVICGLILGALQPFLGFFMNLAYYLNLSIFLVLATLYSEMRALLFFVIPIKMKWLALVDVVLIAVDVIKYARYGMWAWALLPLASFVNYFIFTWPFWSIKFGIARRRSDPKVINFKKAQKQAEKKAQETGGYRHKCAVCGITDLDDPNMEFRYCSKCDGYYCYCTNHINNHIHIHED